MGNFGYVPEHIIYGQVLEQVEGSRLTEVTHRSIGSIHSQQILPKKMNKNGRGTGVLISRDLILTAAHNIYDIFQQVEFNKFRFYPCPNGKAPDSIEISEWRFPEQFKTSPKLKYDYALMKLQRPVQFDSFPQLTLPCTKCLIEKNDKIELKIYGYPVDQGTTMWGQPFLYQLGMRHKQKIVGIRPDECQVAYAISTSGGHSGAPLLVGNGIIGVHVGGQEDGQYNVGRIVTNDFLENIIRWGNEMRGDPFEIRDSLTWEQNEPNKSYNEEQKQAQIKKLTQELKTQRLKSANQRRQASMQTAKYDELTQLLNAEKIKNEQLRRDIYEQAQINIELDQNNKILKQQVKNLEDERDSLLNLIGFIQTQTNINYRQSSKVVANSHLAALNYYQQFPPAIRDELVKTQHAEKLSLISKGLTAIDVKRHLKLKSLILKSNLLKFINVENNANLTQLSLYRNQIKEIDLKNNKNLTQLDLRFNNLTAIDLSNNTSLIQLYLENNQLNEIDLKNNAKITQLLLYENNLGSITFCYSEELSLERCTLNLGNQHCVSCQTTIFYRKEGWQSCKTLKQQLQQEYSGGKNWSGKNFKEKVNKYKSNYRFNIKPA